MKLHIKLTLLIAAFAVVIAGACALLVDNVMHVALEQELDKRGVVIAQTLAEHIALNVIDGEIVAARQALLEIIQRTEDMEFAYVTGFDEEVFAHSFEEGFPRALLPDGHDLIRDDTPSLERYVTQEGSGLLVGYPLIDGMEAHLYIGLDESYLHAQIERIRNQIIAAALLVTLPMILFGILLSQRITRPLEQLSESLRAFGDRRMDRELDYRSGGREVANLTRAFNQMIVERGLTEKRIEHLNAVLRAIRNVNQLIVREKDRDRLLQGACDNLIETRGYYTAWITLLDESGGLVTAAESGLSEAFPSRAAQLKHGELFECGRRALAKPGVVTIEYPLSTCTGCTLAEYHGDNGVMAIRLEHGEKIYGLLAVSIPGDLVLYEGEHGLLREVAGDVAFALYSMELEQQRVQAEEQNRKFNKIIETTSQSVIITNIKGTVLYVNPSYYAFSGFVEDEVIGKSMFRFTHKKGAIKLAKEVVPALLEKRQWQGEMTVVKKDKQIVPVDLICSLLSDEKNKPEFFVAIFSDITERKRAQEQIQRQLAFLEALHAIDRTISASVDINLTIGVFLEQALTHLEVDAADVLLFDSFLQTLECVGRKGFRTSALKHTHLRLGQGLAGQVALQREIKHIPDLQEEEEVFLASPDLSGEAFVAYYGIPLIAKGVLKGVLEIFHRAPLSADDEWLMFLNALAGQAAIAIDNASMFTDLQRSSLELALAYDSTLEGWAKALELKDMETEGHSRRVVDLTMQMASQMGVSGKKLVHIRRGALLHDIGKMGIPDNILQNPRALTDEEWQIMRRHPVYAFEWLSSIDYLRPALDIPYSHHEKWDGSGYPRGLKGEQIPLPARIFAIIDVWDALRSDRPYRDAWSEEKVLAYIQEQSRVHFDPRVVEAFLAMISKTN